MKNRRIVTSGIIIISLLFLGGIRYNTYEIQHLKKNIADSKKIINYYNEMGESWYSFTTQNEIDGQIAEISSCIIQLYKYKDTSSIAPFISRYCILQEGNDVELIKAFHAFQENFNIGENNQILKEVILTQLEDLENQWTFIDYMHKGKHYSGIVYRDDEEGIELEVETVLFGQNNEMRLVFKEKNSSTHKRVVTELYLENGACKIISIHQVANMGEYVY